MIRCSGLSLSTCKKIDKQPQCHRVLNRMHFSTKAVKHKQFVDKKGKLHYLFLSHHNAFWRRGCQKIRWETRWSQPEKKPRKSGYKNREEKEVNCINRKMQHILSLLLARQNVSAHLCTFCRHLLFHIRNHSGCCCIRQSHWLNLLCTVCSDPGKLSIQTKPTKSTTRQHTTRP